MAMFNTPGADTVPHELPNGTVYYIDQWIVCGICMHPTWLVQFPELNVRHAMSIMAMEANYPAR